jgi:hypothetical protein
MMHRVAKIKASLKEEEEASSFKNSLFLQPLCVICFLLIQFALFFPLAFSLFYDFLSVPDTVIWRSEAAMVGCFAGLSIQFEGIGKVVKKAN